jgi:predicted transglutaminase-like cysteine proteinase
MLNRKQTTRAILFASPIGALVAGSIFFTHPDLLPNAPVQPVAFDLGSSPTFFIAPGVAPTQPALENVAPGAAGVAEPSQSAETAKRAPATEVAKPAQAPSSSSTPQVMTASLDFPKPAEKAAHPAGAPLYTVIVEDAKGPNGWDEFCAHYPGECTVKTSSPRDITLTPDAWDTIVGVNDSVNRRTTPVTDRKHWGRVNKWTFAEDGAGDCKDYALLKQRKLIQAGFPREALLIAVVWTRQNQGHAVLLVRTDKGEFALDNLSKQVLLWSKTPYRYVKRQTRTDPNAWVYIDGDPRQPSQLAANDIR